MTNDTSEQYDLFITEDGTPVFVDSEGNMAELEEPENEGVTPPENWTPTKQQANYIEMTKDSGQAYGRNDYELALTYNEQALALGQKYLAQYMAGEIDSRHLQNKLFSFGFFDNME